MIKRFRLTKVNQLHYDLAVLNGQIYPMGKGPNLWSVSEVDCHVTTKDGVCTIVVRGTESARVIPKKWSWKGIREGLSNLRDVGRDLRALPYKHDDLGGYVHRGFGLSADRWMKKFGNRLIGYRDFNISGHSLGAPIAALIATTLHHKSRNINNVVLFGEPKGFYWSASKVYRELLGVVTVSYLNDRDWIQYAGFGKTSVKPTLCYPGIKDRGDNHDINTYINMMT